MMKQSSFSDIEFANKKKLTRRDRFLAEIEAATPWPALVAALLPYYPKGDGRGRPPVGLERMLRMYIAQQCFGVSDEGIEDAIYDSQANCNAPQRITVRSCRASTARPIAPPCAASSVAGAAPESRANPRSHCRRSGT